MSSTSVLPDSSTPPTPEHLLLPIIVTVSLAIIIVCIVYYVNDYTHIIHKHTPTVSHRRIPSTPLTNHILYNHELSTDRHSSGNSNNSSSFRTFDMRTTDFNAYFDRSESDTNSILSSKYSNNSSLSSLSSQHMIHKIQRKLNKMNKIRKAASDSDATEYKTNNSNNPSLIDYTSIVTEYINKLQSTNTEELLLTYVSDLHSLINKCTLARDYYNRTVIVNAIIDCHGLDVLQNICEGSNNNQYSEELKKNTESLLQTILPLIW